MATRESAQDLRKRQLDQYLEQKYGSQQRPKSVVTKRSIVFTDRSNAVSTPSSKVVAPRPHSSYNARRHTVAETPRSVALARWKEERSHRKPVSTVQSIAPGVDTAKQEHLKQRLSAYATRKKTPLPRVRVPASVAASRPTRTELSQRTAEPEVSRALTFDSPAPQRVRKTSVLQNTTRQSEVTVAKSDCKTKSAAERHFNAFESKDTSSPWRKQMSVRVNKSSALAAPAQKEQEESDRLEEMMLADIHQARQNVKAGRQHAARTALASMIHHDRPYRELAVASTLYWLSRAEAEQAGRSLTESAPAVMAIFEQAVHFRAQPKDPLVKALRSFQARLQHEKKTNERKLSMSEESHMMDVEEPSSGDALVQAPAREEEAELCNEMNSLSLEKPTVPHGAISDVCGAISHALAHNNETSGVSDGISSAEPDDVAAHAFTPPPSTPPVTHASALRLEECGSTHSPVRSINSPLLRKPAARIRKTPKPRTRTFAVDDDAASTPRERKPITLSAEDSPVSPLPKFTLHRDLPRDFPREVLETVVKDAPAPKPIVVDDEAEEEHASFVRLAPIPLRGREKETLGSEVKLTPVRRSHRLERSSNAPDSSVKRAPSIGTLLNDTSYTYVPNASVDPDAVYFNSKSQTGGRKEATPRGVPQKKIVKKEMAKEMVKKEAASKEEATKRTQDVDDDSGPQEQVVQPEAAVEGDNASATEEQVTTPDVGRLTVVVNIDDAATPVRRSARIRTRKRE